MIFPGMNYLLNLVLGSIFGMMVIGGLAVMRERDEAERKLRERDA